MTKGWVAAIVAGVFLAQLSIDAFAGASLVARTLLWLLTSDVLAIATLAWIAQRAHVRGHRLALLLFAVSWGIGHAASLVEAAFFDVSGVRTLLMLGLRGIGPTALGVWLVGRRIGTATPGSDAPVTLPAAALAGRLVASSVLYVILYLTAGALVFPFVRDFYEARGLPSLSRVVGMQLFVRGPLLSVLVLLLTRVTSGSRRSKALLSAVGVAVLGGVAPLMVPTDLFPDAVRWAHFVEVSTSNALFGFVAGWMLSARSTTPVRSPAWTP